MSGYTIIDRRKNQKSKSLSNRQRFMERAKKSIRESAKKALGDKALNDKQDVDVTVPADGLNEPHFRHDPAVGEYDIVLPGNADFIVGDTIGKPRQQGGGGGAGNGGEGGEDEFSFALSYDEFVNMIFDDLELPDLVKTSEKNAIAWVNRRAGHTNVGIPSNLNVEKTAISGMARRIALRAPKTAKIKELEEELAELRAAETEEVDPNASGTEWLAIQSIPLRIKHVEAEIAALKRRANAISFLDDVDLRYNNFIKQPKPITQAVVFFVMDVSFSMQEREKIIAKKFFLLLHLFLQRRYKNIEVVFVRHHDTAMECDEEAFFTSREGGGTVVSSGYELVKKIIGDRYPADDWNIYMAQASDGDNYDSDNAEVTRLLNELLPIIQHFVYIEIEQPYRRMSPWGMLSTVGSNLWKTIEQLQQTHENMSCGQIGDEREVVDVFRDLFKKGKKA